MKLSSLLMYACRLLSCIGLAFEHTRLRHIHTCLTRIASFCALQDCLLDFLKLMGDPDRHVRKAAVVAVSAVVHHKPGLVSSSLQELLPLLMDQTVIKPEMVGQLGSTHGLANNSRTYSTSQHTHMLTCASASVRLHADNIQTHELLAKCRLLSCVVPCPLSELTAWYACLIAPLMWPLACFNVCAQKSTHLLPAHARPYPPCARAGAHR